MRRNTLRHGVALVATGRSASLYADDQQHQLHLKQSAASYNSSSAATPTPTTASRRTSRTTRRRRPTSISAFTATTAILVSSILVSSPAMMTPVSAQLVKAANARADAMPVDQFAFGNRRLAKQQSLSDLYPVDPSDDLQARRSLAPPLTSRQATLQSRNSGSTRMDEVDDHLPDHLDPPALHRQYARQYDDQSALFGERDPSVSTHALQLDNEPTDAVSPHEYAARGLATSTSHRYSLPSTYPSSIASSWSRPERSVWFQQKAIIITSIFLAIFIVLFIGAAVFLREKKFDDQLAGLDDEEALARIEERMTMGRFSDPTEKDPGRPGARFKNKLGIRSKKRENDGSDPDSDEPSSGSSSAVKRKRYLVSRWTRSNLRGSNETPRGTSDSASIRSSRSARRVALGDPRAQEESVEITYDSEGAEVSHGANAESGNSSGRGARDGSSARTDGSTTFNQGSPTSDGLANRPRSPPPPHPDSGTQRHTDASSSTEGRSSSNRDNNNNNNSSSSSSSSSSNAAVDPEPSLRSPRRVLLDDSDFQAADAHDDMRHMPPAYIPSGSSGVPASNYDGAALAAALSRGDAKNGIPPPEERDATVPHEVINAVLAESQPAAAEDESTGPTAAHIATDDKAVLGALSAAASMPSAPAYGDTAGGSGSGNAGAASGPSAPAIEVDTDGFELPPATGSAPPISEKGRMEGKGKAKQPSPSLLPAPPVAVEPAFSPFDQPYRPSAPPGGANLPSEPPSTRKSEKQKEAEEEEEQLANLVASQPQINVPRYERDASAPPMIEPEAEEERRGVITGEGLPAYERRKEAVPTAPVEEEVERVDVDEAAPSAPSAPSLDDEQEQEEGDEVRH